jgi:hypothetical protein
MTYGHKDILANRKKTGITNADRPGWGGAIAPLRPSNRSSAVSTTSIQRRMMKPIPKSASVSQRYIDDMLISKPLLVSASPRATSPLVFDYLL